MTTVDDTRQGVDDTRQGAEERLQGVIHRLRARGHRLTPQRMAIIKVLLASQEHLAADQVYERVRVDFPMTSLATIYKTIALLREMGEIFEISFPDEGNRFDSGQPQGHPHIICRRCKTIMDVEADTLDGLDEDVARRTGFREVIHRLEFHGLCPRCQLEVDSP